MISRGFITLLCGILGVLITNDAAGLFMGFLIGAIIEFKLLG